MRGEAQAINVTAGRLFDAEHKMVLFSPSPNAIVTRIPPIICRPFMSSGRGGDQKEDAEFWKQAADVSPGFLCQSDPPGHRVESVLRELRRITRRAVWQL